MLTRTVRIQLVLFLVIALGGMSYVALRYVGLGRFVGGANYKVHVDLSDAGGIFTNAEVDYRGIPVGRVGDMRLTRDGIQIDLDLTSSDKIPADSLAVVADRSVIGEQYVDLQPRSDGGPYLEDGSHIDQKDTVIPPPVQQLLLNSDRLVRSVPIAALQTTVNELYNATRGAGEDLAKLLAASRTFFAGAEQNLPSTIQLLDNSKVVLATQEQESGAITSFSANLKLFSAQLAQSDGDIRKIITTGAEASDQLGGLVSDVNTSLGALLSDLLTTSSVFLQEKDGLREVLVDLPVAIGIGQTVITSRGINLGAVPTFFDPLPCTAGYSGTHKRGALDTTARSLNTAAGCTSGQLVRGSENAP